MQICSAPHEVRLAVREQKQNGKSVGVVPTMGALHDGHVSLVEAAAQQCDFVVTTIFVNPTQFAPGEDLDSYPRTLDDDLTRCRAARADLVFVPAVADMYSPNAVTRVRVSKLTEVLEGAHRPGHFDGVTTVVAKLFHITEPDQAFFGQKDYQQQLVIRQMVADLNWGLEIVTCPTVREPDGLAMSSRNRYLSEDERQTALQISACLKEASGLAESTNLLPGDIQNRMIERLGNTDGLDLDYAVIVDSETLQPLAGVGDLQIGQDQSAVALIAARVGKTRLIDNQRLVFRSIA